MKQLFVDEKMKLETKLKEATGQVTSLQNAMEEMQISHNLALQDLRLLLEITNKKLVSSH